MTAKIESTSLFEKDMTGSLPEQGMLANAYVPIQRPGGKKYTPEDALKYGTLFPGLNLPMRGEAATAQAAQKPMGDMMSVWLTLNELMLYLDTHPNDAEALAQYNTYAVMYEELMRKYAKDGHPLMQGTVMEQGYTWLNAPWPWESV